MASAARTRDTGGIDTTPVDLGGRWEVMPGAPLAELDSPGASAYVCRGLKDRRSELFALVCETPVPPRLDVLQAFRGMDNPAVLRLLDWGTIDWPGGGRRFALVLERPGGRRLMTSLGDSRDPFSDDHIVRVLMPLLLLALREMTVRGVTCGGLRPTNLFLKDATSTAVVIGDCVSTPAGYSQPLLLETIERGMAQPSGRGPGTIADDLYALGMTLLILHLGRNPLRDLDDEAILRLKMDRGTYPALTSAVRLPQGLIEPLRGLMTDDPRQRWTLADLDLWLQGRRLSPKQPQVPRRGVRPFELKGEELWHCRALARAMTRAPTIAAPLIDKGDVDRWVRRSVGDEHRADVLQSAIESAGIGARSASQEERLVARAAIALDPPAPIRYRGVAVLPDGFGPALAEAMAAGGSVQPHAEMVLAQLPLFWVNCQTEFRAELVPLIQLFDTQRVLLEHTGPGFGIERVLYELNPGCPCLSPLVRAQHPLTLPELLQALDTVGASTNRARDPVDRHVLAFIAARNKKLNEALLGPLASGTPDPARRAIAMAAILADAQQRYGPARLPNLCGWMITLLEPAFKRFKNREVRTRLKTEALGLARAGVLDDVLRLVDDAEAIRRDDKGFLTAMRRYEGLTRQIDTLKAGLDDRRSMAEGSGRQMAAVISSVVSGMILILTIIVMLRPS